MMKRLTFWLQIGSTLLLAPLATAHPGHGVVGTLGHDLQHQAWTFAAVIVASALVLAGDRVMAVLRAKAARRPRRESDSRRD